MAIDVCTMEGREFYKHSLTSGHPIFILLTYFYLHNIYLGYPSNKKFTGSIANEIIIHLLLVLYKSISAFGK